MILEKRSHHAVPPYAHCSWEGSRRYVCVADRMCCSPKPNNTVSDFTLHYNDVYLLLIGNSLVFCYTQCYYVWSCQRQRYYSVLVNSASEKPVCIFPCENSPFEKEKRTTKRRRETGKLVVLFHHTSPPTPGLFRIESFPKEIWSFHEDVWHLKPPTSPSSRANAFTAPCRLFSIRQPFL